MSDLGQSRKVWYIARLSYLPFTPTVLVVIQLTKNAVPLRFRYGSCKLIGFVISLCFKSASRKAPNYVQRS